MTYPKRRSTTKIVLIVVAIVLAVCCVGGGIAVYFGVQIVGEAIGPPRDATDAFLDDVEADNYAGAYARLCADVRQRDTAEEFAVMTGIRRPTGHEIVSTNVSNVNGDVSAAVGVKLTYADGLEDRQEFDLHKENNVWKVCTTLY